MRPEAASWLALSLGWPADGSVWLPWWLDQIGSDGQHLDIRASNSKAHISVFSEKLR